MHALSPREGPVESFFNFIQSPLSLLCAVIMLFMEDHLDLLHFRLAYLLGLSPLLNLDIFLHDCLKKLN